MSPFLESIDGAEQKIMVGYLAISRLKGYCGVPDASDVIPVRQKMVQGGFPLLRHKKTPSVFDSYHCLTWRELIR